jgi:2-phosphoglycerate kinase
MNEPYIILIGGATGVGTSSISSKLSELYPVRGFQRTDAIRQVIRTLLSPLVSPEIFQSTYKAYENIDTIYADPQVMDLDKVLYGHVKQSEIILLGLDGAIARDIKEGISSIFEGVHILPGRLKQKDWYTKQIRIKMIESLKDFGVELLSLEKYDEHIIELLIDIDDPEQHKKRFSQKEQREIYAPTRKNQKYLDNFDNIRKIRSFLVKQAEKNKIPIIQNNDLEETVKQCVSEITKRTEGKFSPKKDSLAKLI